MMHAREKGASRGTDSGYIVFVVRVDQAWKPSGPHDVPPGMEVYQQKNELQSSSFVDAFNEQQLIESNGRWAIGYRKVLDG